MPGFCSGNQWKSTSAGKSDRLAPVTGFTPRPDTTGEKNTRTTQEMRPP